MPTILENVSCSFFICRFLSLVCVATRFNTFPYFRSPRVVRKAICTAFAVDVPTNRTNDVKNAVISLENVAGHLSASHLFCLTSVYFSGLKSILSESSKHACAVERSGGDCHSLCDPSRSISVYHFFRKTIFF